MTPPDLFSVAPPAFTTDLSDDDDSMASPFAAKASRKKIGIIAGACATMLFLGIVVVSLTGGSAEASTKAAAGRADLAAAAAPLPPVPPVAVQAPPPVASPAINLPPPPTTGAASSPKPPAAKPAVLSKPRPAAPSGPKLQKVQSGGVAGH